jgi:hypothetical protein
MRRWFLFTVFMFLCSPSVLAQPGAMGGMGSTPLAVDLKKVPVGSWAEYSATIGQMTMKSRWAFVARDKQGHTVEMTMEGGPMAMMGGKMAMKMVLVPDPTTSSKPVKQMVMQMGSQDPMEMPLNMPNMPTQKFQKPDPKKLVGKETINVAAGSFKTSHYRDTVENGTTDVWVSEDVAPLGMVKVQTTPTPGAKGPGGMPMPSVSMELVARGKDAKPTITKAPKPFNPALMFGGGAGRPSGAAAPADGASPAPKTPSATKK